MITFTNIQKLFRKVASEQPNRPMAEFEAVMLANMKVEPDKWFIDFTGGSNVLRAANREKGVAVSVGGVIEGTGGFLQQEGEAQARCGRVELSRAFSQAFANWALAQFNSRHKDELTREHERVSRAISDAFR